MAKDNSNANRDRSSADVHLVLNGKGGVGNSVAVTWLAEFLISRGDQCLASTETRTGASANTKRSAPRNSTW
jgi:hypothetical protein